jgi:hypothetical protein
MDSNEWEDYLLKAKGKCTIDNNIPDFSQDEFFLKKLAQANESIRKYGLPKELGPLTYEKPGPEWDDAF